MEKCNFLKILQCPDFENLWGDSWHLFQPKKLDESDGGFCFLRIIFSSHVDDSGQLATQERPMPMYLQISLTDLLTTIKTTSKSRLNTLKHLTMILYWYDQTKIIILNPILV